MRRADGFTLVEVLVVVVIAAILALLAWPGLQGHLQRARRHDGVLALLAIQQQQARWRAEHPTHASAAELGAAAWSPDGHYRLHVLDAGAAGYTLQAVASGAQAADAPCATLRLVQAGADTQLQSLAAGGRANAEPENRRCWGR